MKKTFVALATLSIVIVATLLAGIACSSQSSSGGLPAGTSSDSHNVVVLTQKLTYEAGEAHLRGKIEYKGPVVRAHVCLNARFYDAQGNIVDGEAISPTRVISPTQGQKIFEVCIADEENLWVGDILDYDIAFSSKTQPVRYDLKIDS